MKHIINLLTILFLSLLMMTACGKQDIPPVPVPSGQESQKGEQQSEESTGGDYEGDPIYREVSVWIRYEVIPATVPTAYNVYAEISEPVACEVYVTDNWGDVFHIPVKQKFSEKMQWPTERGELNEETCYAKTVSPKTLYDNEYCYTFTCDR